MAFDLLDFTIPFSDKSKKNMIGYNYKKDVISRPPSLYHSLYNFQKVGIQFGVGKTIQAISISYLFQRDWPVLIITPSSLKYSWRDELLTWIEHLRQD